MGNQRTRVPITFYEGDHYDTVPPPNHNDTMAERMRHPQIADTRCGGEAAAEGRRG
jgi:hypothetical protein